ncbi:hypothetical protein IQ06DRAFT_288787 [Phaeosphaeriaceae sp. SRC1lsM3a]|nr:hypothetical protein IQ06DRAFT_288787 [Stagonospora sp. SRC1lsM3a]
MDLSLPYQRILPVSTALAPAPAPTAQAVSSTEKRYRKRIYADMNCQCSDLVILEPLTTCRVCATGTWLMSGFGVCYDASPLQPRGMNDWMDVLIA